MATTPQTLASRIRAKYPGAYGDLSDADLETKILAKYPEYASLPRTQVSGGATMGEQLAAKGSQLAPDPTGKQTSIGPRPSFLEQLRAGNVPGLDALSDAMKRVGTPAGAGLPEEQTIGGRIGQTIGMLTKNPAAQALIGAIAPHVIDATLPNVGRAGAALNEVRATAGSIPIDMEKPGNTALQLFEQSQRGASLPSAIRKFVIRATTPGAEPITFAEAKDFQSNISNLSATEKASISPNQYRLIGQLNADLKDSLKGAADVADLGDKFSNAMQEYHAAMVAKGWGQKAMDLGWKIALGAGAAGSAMGLKELLKK